MGFTVDYMMKLNDCKTATVFEGTGEFLDFASNEIYKIHNITMPFTSDGKHLTVFSKEDGCEDTVEDRDYFDGKILSFVCEKVYHREYE